MVSVAEVETQGKIMTRLIAIAALLALAVFLFRYRTNEKLQHWVVLTSIIAVAIYTVVVVIGELAR